jgi:hypothetical protein
MADKEMIAATLAAGVLAAAPPVLDPLAAAKEAASLYLEVLDQLEREARAREAEPTPRGFCPRNLFCGTADPRPILGQGFERLYPNAQCGCDRSLQLQ